MGQPEDVSLTLQILTEEYVAFSKFSTCVGSTTMKLSVSSSGIATIPGGYFLAVGTYYACYTGSEPPVSDMEFVSVFSSFIVQSCP